MAGSARTFSSPREQDQPSVLSSLRGGKWVDREPIHEWENEKWVDSEPTCEQENEKDKARPAR
jgi:hypothetical protein